MSWNKTDHEGKVCYERDGMRVFRTQDIEAIERQERIEFEQRNTSRIGYEYTEREETESDLTPAQVVILLVMLIGAILYAVLNTNIQ